MTLGSIGFRLSKPLLNTIFIFSLSLLIFLTYSAYYQVNQLINASHWLNHTYEVIQHIDSAMFNLVELESKQRGFLITNDDHFLHENDERKIKFNRHVEKLLNLTSDFKEQNDRIKEFNELAHYRLSILSELLRLKASNRLNTPEGEKLLNKSQNASANVLALGEKIKAIEKIILEERNTNVIKSANATNRWFIIGGFCSLLFLSLAFTFANIELYCRRQIEFQNKTIHTRLRRIIESASDMIAALDKKGRFIVFNEAYQLEFKRLFNRTICIGASLEEFLVNLDSSKNEAVNIWKQSLQGNEILYNLEFAFEDQKNVYELSSSLIQNGGEDINGVVHSVRNITKRVQDHMELQASYAKLAEGMQDLKEKNSQITLLVEMSDILLTCSSQRELGEVMANYCQRLFKFASGFLFVMHPSKNYLTKEISWGEPNMQDELFTPDQCWGIRLGRIHRAGESVQQLTCNHIKIKSIDHLHLMCIPLMAQNDIYGLLYLEMSIEHEDYLLDENQKLLISAFSELTALALANVRLRENLRYQSIRDPLTGLYNRRYLEDFLFEKVHLANKEKVSIAALMLDLDHFKKINDMYGHDAGDSVLKEFGEILQKNIRDGDIASRYGGEEFLVILYNVDAKIAKAKAETIRESISKLQVKYGAQLVGPLHVSIGIALYPNDSINSDELLENADRALYHAKNHGRDQVILYSEIK